MATITMPPFAIHSTNTGGITIGTIQPPRVHDPAHQRPASDRFRAEIDQPRNRSMTLFYLPGLGSRELWLAARFESGQAFFDIVGHQLRHDRAQLETKALFQGALQSLAGQTLHFR